MDEDLAAEIARLEAELAQDNVARQAQGLAVPSQPPQTANSFFPQQQPQATTINPFAKPFQPTAPQQPQPQPSSYGQQQGAVAVPEGSNKAVAAHNFTKDTDGRSIFVGNLPKGDASNPQTTTPEELVAFFQECGEILHCTVLRDRATHDLKGTAYIEFANYSSMGIAIDTKNNANFKGNTIIVC